MSMDSYDVAMILFCVGCLVGSGQSSTCNVQCDYDHVTGKADCSHRNLDCIPVNYPDTLVMDLTHNNISVLDPDDFNRTFTRLVELYLDYNRVADVASLMTSTEMGNLTKLSVQHNIISNLGFPCSLDSLEFMLVDNNLLKYLHDFSNCQRLKYFSADSNELHSISIQLHRESFPSFVSLRFNRITNVNIAKTTTGVYNLTLLLDHNEASRVHLRGYPIDQLSLSHSKFQVINIPVPTKLIISSDGLSRLNNKLWTFQPGNKLIETLDIRNNSFDSLIQPDWAEGLQILHADDNILANLSSKTLKGFVDLKELHLASNRLLFISSTALSHLTMLRSLYLDGNFLTSLLGGIFLSQAELVELSITNNQLSFLHPDYFIGLNSLERLYLTRNRLLYVHSGMFRQMSRLNTLDVSQNELNVFNSTNCSFLNHLENLLLAHNSVHDISCVLGHCDSLVMLNLSFNQIKVVPGVSLTGKNRALSKLELEGNPLQCDCRLTGLRDWLLNNPPSALPRCQGPPRYSGAVITNLGIHDLSCSPPKVMIKENQLNVRVGQTATLSCKATGVPAPNVTWLDPNGTIISDERQGRFVVSSDITFHIISVEISDQGMYTCLARNTLGKMDRAVINLIVTKDLECTFSLAAYVLPTMFVTIVVTLTVVTLVTRARRHCERRIRQNSAFSGLQSRITLVFRRQKAARPDNSGGYLTPTPRHTPSNVGLPGCICEDTSMQTSRQRNPLQSSHDSNDNDGYEAVSIS